MIRRIAAALVALAALGVPAACGSGGSTKPSAATSTTTGSGNETAYIDAVYAGLVAETPTAPNDDLHCIARAIVSGIGVERLQAAGVSVRELRSPDFEPPSTIAKSMNTAERVALATRLQACGIGRIVGSQVSLEFARERKPGATIDAAEIACFGRGFEGAAARRMIAGMMLSDLTIPDANRLAGVTVECIGLASLIENASGVKLTSVESQCIDRVGRTDTTFLRLLADEFRNVPSTPKTAQARMGAQALACLTPAHLATVAGPS